MATKKPRETCENSKHVTEATTPKNAAKVTRAPEKHEMLNCSRERQSENAKIGKKTHEECTTSKA